MARPKSPSEVRFFPTESEPGNVERVEPPQPTALTQDPIPPMADTEVDRRGDGVEPFELQAPGPITDPEAVPPFELQAPGNMEPAPEVPSFKMHDMGGFSQEGNGVGITLLYHPTKAPCLGQVSFPGPAALMPGEFDYLRDMRLDGRGLRVRYGANLLIAHTANDTIMGAWIGMLNGTMTLIRAVYSSGSSNCRIEKADSAVAPTTWTEISSNTSTDKYGVTRFSSSTAGVSFQVVKEIDTSGSTPLSNNRELLIIQNGVETPRVYDSTVTNTNGAAMAKVTDISHLNNGSAVAAATWGMYYNFRNTITNGASTDANFTVAYNSVTGTIVTFGSAMTGGTAPGTPGTEAAFLEFVGSLTAGGNNPQSGLSAVGSYSAISTNPFRQLHVVYASNDPEIWKRLKFDISHDGSTYVNIWDSDALTSVGVPDLSNKNMTVASLGGEYFLAAFDLGNIGSTTSANTPLYWKLTWLDVKPSADVTLTLVAAGFGGAIQAGAQFGATIYSSGSHTESPGVIYKSAGTRLDQIGGASQPCGSMYLPLSSLLFYCYNLTIQVPAVISGGANATGSDYIFVYMKPIGGTEFLYHSSFAFASYSTPTWTLAGLTSGTTAGIVTSLLLGKETTTLRPMPDGLHRAIPIGGPMKAIGSRLAVGDVVKSSGDSQKGDVWISADGHPFRFRPFVRYIDDSLPDLRSPTRLAFQGEVVQTFARISGSILGADSLLIFTNEGLYSVDGNDSVQLSRPRRIGPYGTLSPRSVAEHGNQVFWLDQNRHVRSLSANMASLSQGRVEDQLTTYNAGANLSGIFGAVFEERYYLTFSISGGGVAPSDFNSGPAGSNELGLVYDIRRDAWVLDYYATAYRSILLPTVTNGETKMYGFRQNGALYRVEDPNAVGVNTNETIRWIVRTGILNKDLWMPVQVGRVGISMEQFTGDITVTRTDFEEASNTANSTIHVNTVTNDLAWRWDGVTDTKEPVALSGLGIKVQLENQGTNCGGKKIFSIVAEVNEVTGEGPDV